MYIFIYLLFINAPYGISISLCMFNTNNNIILYYIILYYIILYYIILYYIILYYIILYYITELIGKFKFKWI
jgi:hypothetical protein